MPRRRKRHILECDGVAAPKLTGLEQHYLINIDHHAQRALSRM